MVKHPPLSSSGHPPKGTSSRRFQEQSTTARPLVPIRSCSVRVVEASGQGCPNCYTAYSVLLGLPIAAAWLAWLACLRGGTLGSSARPALHSQPALTLSWRETQLRPTGLSMTPWKLCPSRSSCTTPCRASRVPVQRLRSHCPRSCLKARGRQWALTRRCGGSGRSPSRQRAQELRALPDACLQLEFVEALLRAPLRSVYSPTWPA